MFQWVKRARELKSPLPQILSFLLTTYPHPTPYGTL